MAVRMKVFGIGLNKTGTTTLNYCLRSLGYRHLTHNAKALTDWTQGRKDDVFALIDQYDSFDDWPYPLMYRELHARYPEAKFILTVRRDAKSWLRSLKKHSLNTSPTRHHRKMAYGFDYPFGHEQHHIDFYHNHNASVKAFFEEKGEQDRLLTLCWENGDGWRELAPFLGVPEPDEAIPRANEARPISWTNPRQLQNRFRAGFWGRI